MSRTRDIAIEFFGKKEGNAMAPADVYQRLAREVVSKLVNVEANSALNPPKIYDIIENPDFLAKAVLKVSASRGSVMDAAYQIGYEAQKNDALADEADRYNELNELAAIYERIVPEPL